MQIEIVPTLEPVPDGCKLCTSCWTMLPVVFFGTNKDGADGLRSHCKDCASFRTMTRPNFHQQMNRTQQSRRGVGPLPSKERMDLVWEAWGQCYSCGVASCDERMTIGHILPLCKGGSNNITNLAPQCSACNSSQGGKTLEEWCPEAAEEIMTIQDDILTSLIHSDY